MRVLKCFRVWVLNKSRSRNIAARVCLSAETPRRKYSMAQEVICLPTQRQADRTETNSSLSADRDTLERPYIPKAGSNKTATLQGHPKLQKPMRTRINGAALILPWVGTIKSRKERRQNVKTELHFLGTSRPNPSADPLCALALRCRRHDPGNGDVVGFLLSLHHIAPDSRKHHPDPLLYTYSSTSSQCRPNLMKGQP